MVGPAGGLEGGFELVGALEGGEHFYGVVCRAGGGHNVFQGDYEVEFFLLDVGYELGLVPAVLAGQFAHDEGLKYGRVAGKQVVDGKFAEGIFCGSHEGDEIGGGFEFEP